MPVFSQRDFITEYEVDAFGARTAHWISQAGGLTQFGAFLETLPPGSRSSLKHWHSDEDEMIYVLEGEITVIEGDAEAAIGPGCAATFRAGVAVGHCLINRTDQDVRYLVVGTRATVDHCTYPEHQRVCFRDRSLPEDVWRDMQGEPASNPYRDSEPDD